MDPLVRIELDKLWVFAGEIDYRRVLLACAFIGAVGYVTYRLMKVESEFNFLDGRLDLHDRRLRPLEKLASDREPETDCAPKA